MRKRVYKILAAVAVVLLLGVVGTGLWLRSQVTGSLPQLDGVQTIAGLQNEVRIERDALGIPTIHAKNRLDLAFATGFLHAQDRYFQMDLLRRNSAGELSELVGPAALDHDREVRIHRFRNLAQRILESSNSQERELLEAYSAGANAGLAGLAKKPFEYLLIGETPAAWKPEDSALVMFSMYLDLQGSDFRDEAKLGLMSDVLPAALFEFMRPRGTSWDAPIQGDAFDTPPIPGSEVLDTRQAKQVSGHLLTPLDRLAAADVFHPGSNNWAVAGSHTTDGRAMVANDMHLGFSVPHIWYRASFVWPDEADSSVEQRMTGASLPGTPAIVVGSNGHVAWGFTNSEGDWVDVVQVETEDQRPDHYLTPDGPKAFEHHAEIIKVKGGPDDTLDVVSTIWGPIVDRDYRDRPRAIRWVAHDTDGVNMGLLHVESAKTLEDALRLANLSGSPAQNFVVADDQGRIAWTILGRIPRRVGFDGRLPSSWADGSHRWDGYLTPEEYPRVINPDQGRLWTANARVVGGEFLAKLGDGGYDLGARAKQIRDDLLETDKATEADMLRIQLDDRALFLEGWRQVLLSVLTPEALAGNPQRAELRAQVEKWGGHASGDSVGFRVVREFRHRILAQLADLMTNPCKQVDEKFSVAGLDRTEGPVWRLVSERPEHLLDPRFESWDALLLAAADQVNARATGDGAPLSAYTWGRYNTTRIQHPLSMAVPKLSDWLDMPARALDGDSENIPRIQAPKAGASQRMAVSPGHEADGYFHMPCGQSGHPMSPHYGDAQDAWAEGKPTSFLPGPKVHELVLKPAAWNQPLIAYCFLTLHCGVFMFPGFRILDLSVSLEHQSASEPMPADIHYVTHGEEGRDQIERFLGVRREDLVYSDGLGWAVEEVRAITHTGTHVDAPYHYSPTSEGRPARTIDEVPLEWCLAPGVVLDLRHKAAGDWITIEDLSAALSKINYRLRPRDIVLLQTGADQRMGSPDYFAQPGLGREGTLWLVEQGVKVIGIDAYTLDRPFANMRADYERTGDGRYIWPAHFAGITREYCQIEKLAKLDQLPRPFGFLVSCLPVKIHRASAAWCRAVALIPEAMAPE